MDLRKGTEVKEGMRRCIRCSGRKKMYKIGKTGSAWSHNNSGGVLTDCPLCLGKGIISKNPPTLDKEPTPDKEEKKDVKTRRKSRKKEEQEIFPFEKEY